MKIAIIESDRFFKLKLKQLFKYTDWNIKFYTNSTEFSKAKLFSLNVIIADQNLPGISGRELLHSIHDKTSADLYLMSASLKCFCEEDDQNDYIKGLLKKDPKVIIDKLQYIETKLRINQLIEKEDKNLNEIVINANGYSFEIKGNVAFIGFKRLLSPDSKKNLFNKIQNSKINKAIVSYPNKTQLGTKYYGQLLDLCKFFKYHEGKLAFWNINENEIIRKNLRNCKLDKIISIFNNTEKAIEFLNNQ